MPIRLRPRDILVSPQVEIDVGLVGLWNFDQCSVDTRLLDASGNANHGVKAGTPKWLDSPVGPAMDFSSVGAYYDVSTPGARLPLTGDKMTCSLWLNPSNSTGQAAGVWGNNGSGSDQFTMYWVSSKPSFYVVAGGAAVTSGSGTLTMATGAWSHYAGVYDGAKVYSYLNGILQASATATGNLGSGASNAMEIGGSRQGNNVCNGAIADVRLYNRALDGAEILAIYLAALQPYGDGSPVFPARR